MAESERHPPPSPAGRPAGTGLPPAPFASRVLAENPDSRVECIETGPGRAVVRKTYRSRRFLRWRTFLVRSRARREFTNLRQLAAAGIPCVPAIDWGETRILGCTRTSFLVTGYGPGNDMRTVLRGEGAVPPARARSRKALARSYGALARGLHEAGFLSTTLQPRNVLVGGRCDDPDLALCDQPSVVAWPRTLHLGRLAMLDLYDIAFSSQRRSEFSRSERYRLVLAYAQGDRQAVRRIWCTLEHRPVFVHRLFKRLAVGFLARVASTWLRPTTSQATVSSANSSANSLTNSPAVASTTRSTTTWATASTTSAYALPNTKVANYRSASGARAYKGDHEKKLHRRISTARELKIYHRFLDRIGPIRTALDLPCGHGRLHRMLRSRSSRVIEADFSQQMLELNAVDHGRNGATRYVQCSALEIPLAARSVDLVLSIRLNHHLETVGAREAHLRELFRVADRAVVVSWFSATSLKNVWRSMRAPFNRSPTGRCRCSPPARDSSSRNPAHCPGSPPATCSACSSGPMAESTADGSPTRSPTRSLIVRRLGRRLGH